MKREPLMVVLDTVVLLQLLTENLEELQATALNRQKLKVAVKNLLKETEPIANDKYSRIFELDSETTQGICTTYNSLVQMIARRDIPDKMFLESAIKAREYDVHTMDATISRIIKKWE